jgi:tight adherence protein D
MKQINFSLSVMLYALALAGCQTTASSVTVNQQEVLSMEKVGNYDGLIRHYQDALEDGKSNHHILEQLALAYFNKGDIESAQFYVSHLHSLGASSASLYQLDGQVSDAQGDIESAIDAYQFSIEKGNQSGRIHLLLGVAYAKLGEFDSAKSQFNLARLKGYDDWAIKNNLAMLHMAKGDFDGAIDTLSPIFKANPENKTIRANLAIALLRTENLTAARRLLLDEYSDRELELIAKQLSELKG